MANGLGSNNIFTFTVNGSTVYAATYKGLSISNDGGKSFTNYSTSIGLGDECVYEVWLFGSTIYASTSNGVSISYNGGKSFMKFDFF
ncbi:MAG: hypothetical protein HQK54_08675 [Oligoflexales bacterium]|nr:hypothetical protein [Oligoflexales bacterium]